MALRFYAEFKDDQGDVWRVNLYDDVHTTAASQATLGPSGFKLSYDGNNEDVFQHIIGSSVTFEMMDTAIGMESFLFDDLPNRQESDIKVEIRKDPDGDDTMWWVGILLAEQTEIPDMPSPNPITFKAADGVGFLQDLKKEYLTAGDEYQQQQRLRDWVAIFLKEIGTSSYWGTGDVFLRYVNDIYEDGYSGSDFMYDTTTKLIYNESSTNVFGELEPYTVFEYLKGLLIVHNARLFQSEGVWWFLPLSYYERITNGITPSTMVKQADTDLATVTLSAGDTTYLNSNKLNTIGTGFTKLNGSSMSFLSPKKKVTRLRRILGRAAIYAESTPTATYLGTANNYGDFDDGRSFAAGVQLKITCEISYYRDGETFSGTNEENVTQVYLNVNTLIGTQYLVDNDWSTSSGTTDYFIGGFTRSSGANFSTTISNVTAQLPSDQSIIDFVAKIRFDDGTGADVSSDMTDGDIYVKIVLEYEGQDTFDEILFTAESSYSNTDETDQGMTMFGQEQATGIDEGVIGDALFKSTNTTTATQLNLLGVSEGLRMTQRALQIRRGQFYSDIPRMWQIIQEGADFWIPFTIDTNVNARLSQVERWIVAYDNTTTVLDDTGLGGIGAIGGGISGGGTATPTGTGTVESVNGVSPVSGDVTIDSDDVDFTGTGGGSVTSAIGANTTNIEAVKAYVVSATDKVTLTEDSNNKIEVDGTSSSEKVTVTVAGVSALEIDDVSASFGGLVKSDGIELVSAGDSLIMKDSAGDRWRIQIQTDGTLRTTKL